ncbi:hypothetical protein LCGC14_1658960 [marine sediment metagenome]|uniref:Methyltransferase type 11 domain-containing protein n=1 Tax=marine sediment metagenome TaxID=412755 RepID=A0A0F9HVD8_9ZZZZ
MAGVYERVAAGGLYGFHRRVAAEVGSSVGSGRVLDVGTGPGYLLAEIARQNPQLELVGMDISSAMLKIAAAVTGRVEAARADPASGGRISLVRGDVGELPFPDASFQLVVSTLSLHHWRSPEVGLRECLRVTAAEGECWIYDMRSDASARTLGRLASGRRLGRLALGWVFKFHGVNPKDYGSDSIGKWLGEGADVRVDVQAAYLKLSMRRPSSGPKDITASSPERQVPVKAPARCCS